MSLINLGILEIFLLFLMIFLTGRITKQISKQNKQPSLSKNTIKNLKF